MHRLAVDEGSRARRLGDVKLRLAGPHRKGDAVLAGRLGRQRLQVDLVEALVQLGARVRDTPVQGRPHAHAPRPVLGRQRELEGADVHVGHRDQASLAQRGPSTLAVLETDGPREKPTLQVELLSVGQQRGGLDVEPVLVADAKIERQPVGKIDEFLVLDRAALDLGQQSIIAAGEVGAGIGGAVRLG